METISDPSAALLDHRLLPYAAHLGQHHANHGAMGILCFAALDLSANAFRTYDPLRGTMAKAEGQEGWIVIRRYRQHEVCVA